MKLNGIEYAGQGNTGLTFVIDSGAVLGDAVAMSAAGTAGRGTADDAILGRLETKDSDGLGTVFNRGVIVVPWNGAAVFGLQNVGVDAAGKAKVSATKGRQVFVLGVAGGLAAIDLG